MSKQSLQTILLSVVLSAVGSLIMNLAFERKRQSVMPGVVQAKSVQLIDAEGRVRGTFELITSGRDVRPRLVMRDADGRDSIEMGVNGRGDGALSFSNDYWNEGAVILGHLQNVDDGSESKTKNVADRTGAWGLRVRSPQSKYTGIGFLNSGTLITPMPSDTK